MKLLTDKRHVLKLMREVRKLICKEIKANASGGKYGAGLSGEGYAGGYLQAIDDLEAALTHGYPSDTRHYWKRARTALSAGSKEGDQDA